MNLISLWFELTILKEIIVFSFRGIGPLLACLTAFSALTLLVRLRLYRRNSNPCRVLTRGIISLKRVADRTKNGVFE